MLTRIRVWYHYWVYRLWWRVDRNALDLIAGRRDYPKRLKGDV